MPLSVIDVRNIQGLRCLVIGAGGFIGTALCETLHAYGAKVYGFGRRPRFPAVFNDINFITGDFLDHSCFEEITDGIDIVFHLLSTTLPASSNKDKIFDVESNLLGTVKLLEQCQRNGVRKIIFLSSGGTIYGPSDADFLNENAPTNPICSYGIVKLSIEKYLALFYHLYGLDYSILRVSNPFGPYQLAHKKQGIISTIFSRVMVDRPVTVWGDGNVVRDYIYISDVIDATVKVALYGGAYKLFNVGSNVGRSILDLIQAIQLVIDRKMDIRYEAARAVDIPRNVLSNNLIKQELGWCPSVGFQDGLQKTHDWLAAQVGDIDES